MTLSRLVPLVCALSLAATLSACDDDATSPTRQTQVRFINAMSNSTSLTLSINNVPLGGAQVYQHFTNCQSVNPGTFTLTVSQAGTTLLTTTQTLDSLGKYSLIATGTTGAPTFIFVSDAFVYPESGRALMRFVNAFSGRPSVDAFVTPDGSNLGASVASNILVGTASAYANIPNDRSRVDFAPNGSTSTFAGQGPFDIPNRSAQTTIGVGSNTTFRVPACY